jgi:amino acid permease
MGNRGKQLIDFMIMITQFSFTISQVSFVVSGFKSFIDYVFDSNADQWSIAALIIVIYTLLSWVRKIQKFSFAYMLGSFLILFVCSIIAIYCLQKLSRDGIAEGI